MNKQIFFIKSQKYKVYNRVSLCDIRYIECEGDYASIWAYTDNALNRYMIRQTMAALIDVLNAKEVEFARIHQSYIVRIDMISQIGTHCEWVRIYGIEKTVPVGKKFKEAFLSTVNLFL